MKLSTTQQLLVLPREPLSSHWLNDASDTRKPLPQASPRPRDRAPAFRVTFDVCHGPKACEPRVAETRRR